jgi:hypothetical protein
VEEKKAIAQEVINILGITPLVRSIVIEKGDTPWSEKALIKWKKDHLDVKAFIWDDPIYLYGRIYRLFLYIVDVLNPVFEYKPRIAPDEEQEPKVRDRYNQIWSIYVDSRMERQGIESFYDKGLRKNLFIDSEKDFSWDAAGKIFEALWDKESYTYPEIIDYSYDLKNLDIETPIVRADTFEKDFNNHLLHDPSVKKHLEMIPSTTFREVVNDIISFAAYQCKDAYIQSKYYGICLLYQKQAFIEMIPTGSNLLYFTIFDAETNIFKTQSVTDKTDIRALQELIKEKYGKIANENDNS